MNPRRSLERLFFSTTPSFVFVARYVLWFSFSTLRFEYLRDCLFSFGFDLPYNLVLSSFLSICSGGFGFVTCFQGLTSMLSGDCHVLAFFFLDVSTSLSSTRVYILLFACAQVGSLVAISNTTSSSSCCCLRCCRLLRYIGFLLTTNFSL